MDPLKPSSQLAASLRALGLARKTVAPAQTSSGDSPGRAEGPVDLRERLIRLVAGVDPADPDAVRRARKPVISAILLAEFGDAARANPRFDEMIASVDAALAPQEGGVDPFLELLRTLTEQNHP